MRRAVLGFLLGGVCRGGWSVRDYVVIVYSLISASARAWVGFGWVSWSKLAPLWRRIVLRARVASSSSRVGSEWQRSPLVVRLLRAFCSAWAERRALATGSAWAGGCSSSKRSGFQAWRKCQAR